MTQVKYIAKTEHGYRPRAHWEEKEFNTHWEADKYCEEHRRRTLNAAYVETRVPEPKYDPDLARASRTVNKYVDRMFRGGRIF